MVLDMDKGRAKKRKAAIARRMLAADPNALKGKPNKGGSAGTNPLKRVDPDPASLSENNGKARGRAKFVPKRKP